MTYPEIQLDQFLGIRFFSSMKPINFKVGICLHLAEVPLGHHLGPGSTTAQGLQAYYSESQRGNTHLIDQDGYHYRMDKKHPRDNSITWRCKLEWKFKCKARAKTVDGVMVRISKPHNHEPPDESYSESQLVENPDVECEGPSS